MAVYKLPLAQLITNQYPYILPVEADAIADNLGYKNVQVITSDQVADKSQITGNPIFMPLNFGGIAYTNDQNTVVNKARLYMPIAIVTPTFRKLIKETPIAGSKKRGEVTELINPGWYEINIAGCFITADRKYPEAEVAALDGYLKAPVAIPVTHKLFTILGITQIVIRGGGFVSKPGFTNMQHFELSCKEDIPIELKITNENSLN